MDAAHGTSPRPVLIPATLSAALLLGLLARISGEPVFGAVGTALLVVAVAAGAGDALSRLQSAYLFRHAYLLPATTALGLYAGSGGVPHAAAMVLVGVALVAGAVGMSQAWPAVPVRASGHQPHAADEPARAEAA